MAWVPSHAALEQGDMHLDNAIYIYVIYILYTCIYICIHIYI